MSAEAIQVGEVRGFVNINADQNLPKTLGKGIFQVSKILLARNKPSNQCALF